MPRARLAMAWAGQDVVGMSAPDDTLFGGTPLREAAAWPFNLARMAIWSAMAMLGQDSTENQWILE
jgi:hypothetical protein